MRVHGDWQRHFELRITDHETGPGSSLGRVSTLCTKSLKMVLAAPAWHSDLQGRARTGPECILINTNNRPPKL